MVKDCEGDVAVIDLDQQEALTLAGQIQGMAIQIRKP